jgi:hypothetical protein
MNEIAEDSYGLFGKFGGTDMEKFGSKLKDAGLGWDKLTPGYQAGNHDTHVEI